MDPRPLDAVCFDFRGVIVDHRDDSSPIPGIEQLLQQLSAKGAKLAIISSFSEDFVKRHLGSLRQDFGGHIYSGSGESKGHIIEQFAEEQSITNLSRVAFIDDKPENLLPVAEKTSLHVIAFRGSVKYPITAQISEEHSIPFAETAENLAKFLGCRTLA